jgi:hypothetical protein
MEESVQLLAPVGLFSGKEPPAYTGRFMMLSMITIIYNKNNNGPTLMELFTATGKLKKFF